MSEFLNYAESREKYLQSMLKFFTKQGDLQNKARIEKELDKLRLNVLRAQARFAGEVC